MLQDTAITEGIEKQDLLRKVEVASATESGIMEALRLLEEEPDRQIIHVLVEI